MQWELDVDIRQLLLLNLFDGRVKSTLEAQTPSQAHTHNQGFYKHWSLNTSCLHCGTHPNHLAIAQQIPHSYLVKCLCI